MQQIIVIHGGDAYPTHEEYITSLRGKEISLERLKQKDWKSTLGKELGEDYDVLTPRLPNAQNARYLEWKIIFDKIVQLLDDNVVLIGHSLGGLFLAKYLSETDFPKKIKSVFLLAAPFSTETNEPLVDFNLDEASFSTNWQKRMADISTSIYHSTDDPVVPYANAEMYKKALTNAALKPFIDRGHFNQQEFPEIIEELKRITNKE